MSLMASSLGHADAADFLKELAATGRPDVLSLTAVYFVIDPVVSSLAAPRTCRRALAAAELLAASMGRSVGTLTEAASMVVAKIPEPSDEDAAAAADAVACLAFRSPLAREAAAAGNLAPWRASLGELHAALGGEKFSEEALPGSEYEARQTEAIAEAIEHERGGRPSVDVLRRPPSFHDVAPLDEVLLSRLAAPLAMSAEAPASEGDLPAERGEALLLAHGLRAREYERVLTYFEREEPSFYLRHLTPGLWRVFVGAARAGRPSTKARKGATKTPFSAEDFCWLVFPLIHTLGGSADRSLLGAISGPDWDLAGGIRPSLAFLDACGAWAVARIEREHADSCRQWFGQRPGGRLRSPRHHSHSLAPLLSLARFRVKLRQRWGTTANFEEAERRVHGWDEVDREATASVHRRAEALADVIAEAEGSPFTPAPPETLYARGQLVRLVKAGVTVVTEVTRESIVAFLPGTPLRPSGKFVREKIGFVPMPPDIGQVMLPEVEV